VKRLRDALGRLEGGDRFLFAVLGLCALLLGARWPFGLDEGELTVVALAAVAVLFRPRAEPERGRP
jgi:hypothetical protein